MTVSKERRSFPRIRNEGLSLKLNTGDYDTITHTLDISASGLYCKIEREIPLMSRVKIALMLPDVSGDRKTAKSLEVDGVVVREHPVIVDGKIKHYDMSVFFDNLPERTRNAIAGYISKLNKE